MYTKRIYFSGGDFHELQEVFRHVPGVVEATAGYLDAAAGNDAVSFAEVASGDIEAVMGVAVRYNPKKMDLSQLMDILFTVVNPYEKDGQGEAKGPMYQCGVFYDDPEDEPQIEYHMNFIASRGRPPAATCANLTMNDPNSNPKLGRKCYAKAKLLENFHPAEEEHQDFLARHPERKTFIDFPRLHELGILE